jgi:hypothetical protein
MGQKKHPRARLNDLVVKQVDDEVIVYDRVDHRASCLNAVTAAVWHLCDGDTEIAMMTGRLRERGFQEAADEVVLLALDQLKRARLLEAVGENSTTRRSNVSRRKLLRELGISAAAVPALSAITVPTAAQAASCLTQDMPCTPGGTPCCIHLHCQPVGNNQSPTGFKCVGESDLRLKHDVRRIGSTVFGLPLYHFKYIGRPETFEGVMAQEVLQVMPSAVSRGADGYYRVNYSALGTSMRQIS